MGFPVAMNWNLAGGVWIVLSIAGVMVSPEQKRWPFASLAWLAGVLSLGAGEWPGVWRDGALSNPLSDRILICLVAGSGIALSAGFLSRWHASRGDASQRGTAENVAGVDDMNAWDWWLLLAMGLGVIMLTSPQLWGALLAWELILLTQLTFVRCAPDEDEHLRAARQLRIQRWLLLWQGTTAVFVWVGGVLLLSPLQGTLTAMIGSREISSAVIATGESWSMAGWVLMVAGCAGRLCLIPGHFLWIDGAARLSPATLLGSATRCRPATGVRGAASTIWTVPHWVISGHQLVCWLCGVWVLTWLVPLSIPELPADSWREPVVWMAWSLIGGWTALAAGLMLQSQEDWSRWTATLWMAGTGWWVWSFCLLGDVPMDTQAHRWEEMSRQLTGLVLGYGLIVWGGSEAYRTGRRFQYHEEWRGLFSVCPSGVLAVAGGVLLFLQSSPWPGWLMDSQPFLAVWNVKIEPDETIHIRTLPLLPGVLMLLVSSLLVWVSFFRWLMLVFAGIPMGAQSVPWGSSSMVILLAGALWWAFVV